jgi:hypothetical protein
MTGGGSVFNAATTVRTTHGFELSCDPLSNKPNNLEINWHKGNEKTDKKFKLQTLTKQMCGWDNSGMLPTPPVAGFNTYYGEGTGSVTGLAGNYKYNIKFVFTDYGEPGTLDIADYIVTRASDNTVVQQVGTPIVPTDSDNDGDWDLTYSGKNLQQGNHQAHGK